MKGVVLAGGTGSRLHPLTLVTNKHLMPVHDRPMIYFPLQTLAGMGIREVMVILGGRSIGDIVELLADGRDFGLDLTYRYQRGSLGIAHAIGLTRDFVGGDSFCVVLGDNVLRGDPLADVATEFEAGPWGGGTLLYRVEDPQRFGVAEFDAAGKVVGFEEKPQQPKSDSIPIGVYFLRPDAFDVIEHLAPSGRGEFEITDVLNHYVERGQPLRAATTRGTGRTLAPSRHSWKPASWPPRTPGRTVAPRTTARARARAPSAWPSMADRGPIAVTGAGGRLGHALRAASAEPLIGWDLPEHDLDRPESIEPLLDRNQPALVIHTAAMTLVDECARQPDLAMRRNGVATGVLAAACHARGVGLLVVSTNEVFSGDRRDGQGYARRTPRHRAIPTVPASWRARRQRGRPSPTVPGSGSPARPGSTGRPATTSRTRSRRQPTACPRVSRCPWWPMNSGRRLIPWTSRAPSWTSSRSRRAAFTTL